MKVCPRCNKTYTDQNLNFCLDDGSVLTQAGGESMPPTVMMSQPRPTDPNPPMQMQQPPQQAGWNTGQQQPQYSMQPKKSSKMWIWVLVILGFVGLICGGGFIGFLVFVGSQTDTVATNATNTTSNGTKASPSPSKSASPSPSNTGSTTTSSDRTRVEKPNLSKWVNPTSLYGTTEMSGSELMMAAKKKGFYYVLAAPKDSFQTENSNITVTVRNVDDADSRLGYGLVFHSNPTPLQQGYAFLIDTKKQKYRVVHHSPGKEDDVINWTSSDEINEGDGENILEVRDLADKIELYINGTMVNSIKNVYGYKGGVVGLYSGDAIMIGFKDLEIRK